MSYSRVVPRDLFNEAKLLKCLGQLALHIHNADMGDNENYLSVRHDGGEFRIGQRASCGGLYVYSGLTFRVRSIVLELYTTYNSKDAFPLLCYTEDGEIEVFTEQGLFTDEFMTHLDKLQGTVH